MDKGIRFMSKNRLLENKKDNFAQEFNAISVGVVVVDESGIVRKVNNALLDYFNNERENFIGKRFGDAVYCKSSFSHEKGCGM